MENIINISYSQTGTSSQTDEQGMREMQRMAFNARMHQYILLKAPPASGKSRALMFIALDKIYHQGLKKVVVAVPEKSIGRSFKDTKLKDNGFFSDWTVAKYFNLCDAEDESNKVERFKEFFKSGNKVLVCTHSTLRYAMQSLEDTVFNQSLLAIDEFHHSSADANSGLGDIVRRLMSNTTAHIIAMTGSYFRGDGIPVLRPEDEIRFYPVTYNYYQQLNGYKYLKSLGIGYSFYQGKYLSAITEALDTTKKTIIHIPSPNARASTGDKYDEVERIITTIGEEVSRDCLSGIITVKTKDGRLLKVADLVEDDPKQRTQLQAYLDKMNTKDAVDIIIALGTAKEGFDWEWCERCLTIGVRGSLTEIVQIIGRCTRDSKGKEHAQFTNLIAVPDAAKDDVKIAVNDFLKAITASLLMEQVMAPVWNFKTKKDDESSSPRKHTLLIDGLKPISSDKTRVIIESQLSDLKASILQDPNIANAIMGKIAPEVINTVFIPKIIQNKYPSLSKDEIEEVRQYVVSDTFTKGGEIVEQEGNTFLKIGKNFINIDALSINLIDKENPFQRAYEIMSKSLTVPVLRCVQEVIEDVKNSMSVEEAIILYKKYLPEYLEKHNGQLPTIDNSDPQVKRLAQAISFLRRYKKKFSK